MKNKKAINLLNYMIGLCHKIYSIQDRLGHSYEDFLSNDIYQLSVCMVIIDFGESANKLSKYLQEDNPQFPWKDVIGLRNIFAHNYMGINFYEVWNVIEEDIPELETLLQEMLSNLK
jgi:uncharacterized protein with HEPN domain